MKIDPLVSIITITYNHEKFIDLTIKGVLSQKTSFPFEYIIAEDCSTDLTRSICSKYQEKFPEIIQIVTSDTNVGIVANEHRALLAAKGKYIAFCEGDDYWTDSNKLQRQVDFLENHPEYSVCFHRCKHYNAIDNVITDDGCGYLFDKNDKVGVDITTEMFLERWITQPLTMVFLRNALDLDIAAKYRYYRDTHQIYHLLQEGKGYLFAFVGGIRIKHYEGIHSFKSDALQSSVAVTVANELYRKNKSSSLKKYYIDVLQWKVNEFLKSRMKFKSCLIAIQLFIVQKSLKRFMRNMINIIYN